MKKLIILLIIIPQLCFGEDVRRDGNWWMTLQGYQKTNYVVGFFDGMQLGHNFSFWQFSNSKDRAKQSCNSLVGSSYVEYSEKYFSNITNIQISDGLDTFYSDYRNRKIKIDGAMWLVAQEISGTPKTQMETMIENWRKNSK